jgi:dTDP-4-dehydrorhamnose reductase
VTERLLVTGCKGQLGSDLMRHLSGTFDVTGVDLNDFDLRERNTTLRFFESLGPAVVLHAAAYTDVDRCETDEDTATAVNVSGTANVAEACQTVGARMVYYSTDYVFDGRSETPYVETDTPNPQTAYGRTKLAGEKRVEETLEDFVILRLAWVYGFHGRNFVRTMLKLGYEQSRAVQRGEIIEPLKVVDDQVGNPTWTMEIARQTETILESDLRGIVHCTSAGETSWFGFARAIFDTLGLVVQMRPCPTREFPRPAPRPAYSSLENRRLKEAGINYMRDWRGALTEFLIGSKEALLSCNAT